MTTPVPWRWLFPITFALVACAPEPAPAAAPSAAPAGPVADEAGAHKALDAALAALSKRNFDVHECAPADLRIAPEPEARAGAPLGERCTMLVARRADRTWLVAVRAATTSAPSRAGGGLALVTVSPGG